MKSLLLIVLLLTSSLELRADKLTFKDLPFFIPHRVNQVPGGVTVNEKRTSTVDMSIDPKVFKELPGDKENGIRNFENQDGTGEKISLKQNKGFTQFLVGRAHDNGVSFGANFNGDVMTSLTQCFPGGNANANTVCIALDRKICARIKSDLRIKEGKLFEALNTLIFCAGKLSMFKSIMEPGPLT